MFDINYRLYSVYRHFWPNISKVLADVDTFGYGISYPLLLNVFDEYLKSSSKLFIVGQQTKGWGFSHRRANFWGTSPWENDADLLIHQIVRIYEGFDLGKHYRASPFWIASHQLNTLINPNGHREGFVWSNLVKLDSGGERLELDLEDVLCEAFPVLPLEIRITKPDVVVFFTGPRYDTRIKKTFPGIVFNGLGNHPERRLCRLYHRDLPFHTYRTYHPNYLFRSKQKSLINEIHFEIKKYSMNSQSTELEPLLWLTPRPDDSAIEEIFRYGLTINGYDYCEQVLHEQCAELANEKLNQYMQTGTWSGSFEELRCCLFFEQRRWHHFGEIPTGEDAIAIQKLYKTLCVKWHKG